MSMVVMLVVMTVVVMGAEAQFWPPGQYHQNQPRPTFLPACTENKLHKVLFNQSDYIQYTQYAAKIPTLSEFTLHFWFKLNSADRTSTFFNYGLNENVENNKLTVQLETGVPQHWKLIVNTVLVARVASPSIKADNWHHVLVSWTGEFGKWSVFLDGHRIGSGINPKTLGLLVPGGGVAVSGQHQKTFHNGMDVGEGLEGFITLFQFSRHYLVDPLTEETAAFVKSLTRQCSKDIGGDIFAWRTTTRKGKGGLHEIPTSERCGNF